MKKMKNIGGNPADPLATDAFGVHLAKVEMMLTYVGVNDSAVGNPNHMFRCFGLQMGRGAAAMTSEGAFEGALLLE